MKFWKRASGPMLVATLALPFIANCELMGALGASCEEMDSGNFAEFKLEGVSADVTANIKGLTQGTFNLNKLAVDLETDLIAACGELGKALGMTEEELKAEPAEGAGAEKVCTAVAGKIDAFLKANADAQIGITIGEPSCYIPVDAMLECLKGCGAVIEPGKLDVYCEGGEISGTCEGECSGACTVEGAADCSGECSGVCEGKCEGSESEGACDGKCEGSCEGSCKMEGKAECSGRCSGGCSAEIKAPACSGEFKPPEVDPTCHMSCSAKAAAQFTCDPPTIEVTVNGKSSAEVKAFVNGLRVAGGKIFAIGQGRAQALVGDVKGIIEASIKLKDSVAKLPPAMGTVKAGACLVGVATVGKSAVGSFSGSISATTKIGGSVSGGGSASGAASGGT